MVITAQNLTQAEHVFEQIMEPNREELDSKPNTKLKTVTLLELILDEVEAGKKGEYLGWVLETIYLGLGRGVPLSEAALFDALESKDGELANDIEAAAQDLSSILFHMSEYPPLSCERIADVNIAVLAAGGRPSQSTSTVSPDTEGVDADDLQSDGRDHKVKNECKERDGYRCVISGVLEVDKWDKLSKADQAAAAHNHVVQKLQVAHIIPSSLTKSTESSSNALNVLGPGPCRAMMLKLTMNQEKNMQAIAFLKWFSTPGEELLTHHLIDSPKNAITLQSDLHDAFGAMKIYFEHVRGHTYRVDAWKDDPYRGIGTTITFERHGSSTAELPSQDLLGLHCTIGRILHMSGAAENVDVLLRQLKGEEVDPNGGTSLGVIVGALLGREGIPVD